MRRFVRLTPLALLCGCTSPPPAPAVPPAWNVHGSRFAGAALAGASAFTGPTSSVSPGCDLQLTVLALSAMPPGDALAAHAAVITRANQPKPLGGHPRSLQDVRVVHETAVVEQAVAAARARWHYNLDLAPDTTTTVNVREVGRTVGPALLLRSERDGCHLALVADDGEQVLLDGTWDPAAPLLLAVPQERADCAGVGLLLQAGTAIDAPMLDVDPERDVAALTDVSRQRLMPPDTRALTLRAQAAAFTTLVGERQRRPALLGLCLRVGAVRCADLALVADEPTLAALAQRVQTLGIDPARADAALAFDLERLAFLALTPELQRDTLPPRLAAFLTRHAGAAGRNAGELEAAIAAATDEASLRAALTATNERALHDSDPAVRVRANDWLARRGIVVPAYDPLGERTARRTALQAFERQRTTVPETGR
ncbi:MAG: hypothetical protein IPK26_30420 [Planctomycetes bacterium]|nr:hypothetical protein [Planctomycetota bacterium]